MNISDFSKWLTLIGTWDFYLLLICFNFKEDSAIFQMHKNTSQQN